MPCMPGVTWLQREEARATTVVCQPLNERGKRKGRRGGKIGEKKEGVERNGGKQVGRGRKMGGEREREGRGK